VAILLRDRENRIVLVKRGVPPSKGSWALPSGFMEIDETPEQACLRELKEETNIEGKIMRLIGVYTEQTRMYKSVLSVAYEVRPLRHHLLAGSDCTDARFFASNELPRIPFASHRQIIEDGLKKSPNETLMPRLCSA
jgi:8-oxo-dGTP diphosphatase